MPWPGRWAAVRPARQSDSTSLVLGVRGSEPFVRSSARGETCRRPILGAQGVSAHARSPDFHLRQRAPYAALSSQDIDPRLPNKRLAAYCESRGLPCFDLTAAFIAASQSSDEPLFKKRDGHWSIRGNRVAAQEEAGHLAEVVCPAVGSGQKTP
jgi:hypothetical protein